MIGPDFMVSAGGAASHTGGARVLPPDSGGTLDSYRVRSHVVE